MPLPESYLTYPDRRPGMDQTLYGWDPADRRAPVHLKSGAKLLVTLVVPLEFFPLNPPAEPFRHPGAIKTPYPDLRHYTTRDYGNRVGAYRLLRAFEDAGVSATFAVNAAVAERYAPLIEAVRAGGHEIAAHGVSTAHIHHAGLAEDEERDLIARCREVLPDARTWMSPARNESFATPHLLTEAGFSTCLDWEIDQRPTALKTAHGSLTALPHYNELSDFKLLLDRSQSEADWTAQILEAARYSLERHGSEGAAGLCFTFTPYVAGQPFRIWAVRDILAGLTGMDGVDFVTASEMSRQFAEAGP